MEAELIVDDEGRTRPARQEWTRLLDICEPRSEIGYFQLLGKLLEKGPSSERQRRLYQTFGSLRTVVQHLAEEWKQGLGPSR
jgi:gamma-glutamyl:cysteine ligase YbdK (ATP-grasp superfamily)